MDLRESFRAPFLQMAWRRHERIVELVGHGEGTGLRSAASELHCLSGEASMLDFADVAALARSGEKAAKDGDVAGLSKLVTDLRAAIEAIEVGSGSR